MSEYRILCPPSGGQAVQMAKAGLQSIYLSGWQVAADSNMASQTYPDQSLYPANSAAKLVERINNAFIRADQIAHMEGTDKDIDFFLPIVADCEAGFGGPLNAFELTKSMVRQQCLHCQQRVELYQYCKSHSRICIC